jgi:FixJ family two-component response regulator
MSLLDESLDLVEAWRGSRPAAPLLIVLAGEDPEPTAALRKSGAQWVRKPVRSEDLELFVRTSSASKAAEDAVRRFAALHGLCQAESDVLWGATIRGEDYDAMAARRACSRLTVRAHAANILRKSGASSLRLVVEGLLREAAGLNRWPLGARD